MFQMNLGLINRPNLSFLYDAAFRPPEKNETFFINAHQQSLFVPPKEFGWFYNDQGEVWAENFRSMLLLPSLPVGVNQINLSVRAWINSSHPKQVLKIFVNGKPLKEVTLTQSENNVIQINASEIGRKRPFIELEFQFLDAKRPKDIGMGNETHLMTMGLQSVQYQ
jgi:hypothetical protein